MATTEEREVTIVFGAMAPPLAEQLAQQGFALPESDAEHFQKDADALSRLGIRGLLTNAERHAGRKRLLKKLTRALKAP